MTRTALGMSLVAALCGFEALARAGASDPAERFREASGLTRAGDYPRALEAYRELATQGHESASLYWNWAQAAAARGAVGEALWALLRGRELEPGDRALQREIERLRENANLDAAEVQPEPLAALARLGRLLHLDLLALALFGLSLLAHAWARWGSAARAVARLAWTTLGLGLLLAAAPLLGSLARPTAVVAVRAATLYDAASPTAAPLGTLREAEVVPILERSRDYLRIEDGSGARGWAHISEVWPLERPRTARISAEQSAGPRSLAQP